MTSRSRPTSLVIDGDDIAPRLEPGRTPDPDLAQTAGVEVAGGPGVEFVEGLEVLRRRPERPEPGRPSLLFVHAAAHGAWSWDEHWMPAAAERGWSCAAMSLRGHGGSPAGARPATLSDYVEDVFQVIVRLPRPPVLVGHSMGALIVQRILARYPARAGVLIAPPGLRHGLRLGANIGRRHPGDIAAGLAFRPLPARPEYLFSNQVSPADARRHVVRTDPESPLAQYQILLPRRVHAAKAPVLVLGGAEDGLVPPIDVVRTARHYATRARLFTGMGHDIMLEPRWREPLDVLLRWLDAGPRCAPA